MLESPPLGCLVVIVGDADGVRLDFTKSIKIELAHKATKVVVLEELRDDFRCKCFGIFDDKCKPIIRPGILHKMMVQRNETKRKS